MKRKHLAAIAVILLLWVAGAASLRAADTAPASAPGGDEQAVRDAAGKFLEAWNFKDYDEARKFLAPDSAGAASAEATAQVLASMTALIPEKYAVADVSKTDSGYKVRYEIEGLHRVSGQRGIEKGTLAFVRTEDAKWRIRLAALAPAPTASSSSLPAAQAVSTLPPSQTIDGWDVERVLKFLTESEQKWQSLRCNLSLTGQMLGQPIQYSGEVVFQKPDKVKVNLGLFEIYSNGQQTWLYVPAAQAYYLKSGAIGNDGGDVGSFVGIGGAEIAQRYYVALVAVEPVSGRPAFKLLLQPKQSQSAGLLGAGTLALWVDRENGLPLLTQYSDNIGGSISVSYTNYTQNPQIAPGMFNFTPPPGSIALPSFPGLEGVL